jgi:hypothetical protein
MSAGETQKTKEELLSIAPAQFQAQATEEPQEEVENLTSKQSKWFQPLKISAIFIITGTSSLIVSIIRESQTLAFIGLGLTFWGALFLFVRPIKYVESSLLDSTATSEYLTIDRIIKDLKQKGKSYYIPPCPEETHLPEHLKGLKDMAVFVSAEANITPPVEEIAKGKFLVENSRGICISPPGLGLLAQLEKELGTNATKLELALLCANLPRIAVDNFQLAKEIEMRIEGNQVYTKISDSTYKRLYTEETLKSVHYLGCPLASAIACAIAKSTGRIVTVQKDKVSRDGQTIELWFSLLEG